MRHLVQHLLVCVGDEGSAKVSFGVSEKVDMVHKLWLPVYELKPFV